MDGHCVHQPVGPHLGGALGEHLDPEVHTVGAHDQGLAFEIAVAQGREIMLGGGNHIGDGHRLDIPWRHVFQRHQLGQPHRIFVGGAVEVVGTAPTGAQLLAVENGENHVGVA